MHSDELFPQNGKAQVRTRVRVSSAGDELRIKASVDEQPQKKRKANKGSYEPGVSGNPKGRPKGAKGTKAMVRKILSKPTPVRSGGKTKVVPLFDALVLKEVELAANGDWRARKTVLELARWALPEEVLGTKHHEPTTADDSIISWFTGEVEARLLAQRQEKDRE
jgi:Family of unknown function (DUF5681)